MFSVCIKFVHVALSCTLQLLCINQIIHLAYACTLYETLGMFSVCICICGLIMHIAYLENIACLRASYWMQSVCVFRTIRLETYLEDNEYFLCSIIMFVAYLDDNECRLCYHHHLFLLAYLEDIECGLSVLAASFDSSSSSSSSG